MHTHDLSVVQAKIFSVKILFSGAALTLGHSRRAYGGPGPFRMPDLQLAQITSVLGGDCRITSVLVGDL